MSTLTEAQLIKFADFIEKNPEHENIQKLQRFVTAYCIMHNFYAEGRDRYEKDLIKDIAQKVIDLINKDKYNTNIKIDVSDIEKILNFDQVVDMHTLAIYYVLSFIDT